jgi:hypothetical protein
MGFRREVCPVQQLQTTITNERVSQSQNAKIQIIQINFFRVISVPDGVSKRSLFH